MGVIQANLKITFWILPKVIRLYTNRVRPRFAYLKDWQPLRYLRRAQSIHRRRIFREVDRACAATIAGHFIFRARRVRTDVPRLRGPRRAPSIQHHRAFHEVDRARVEPTVLF